MMSDAFQPHTGEAGPQPTQPQIPWYETPFIKRTARFGQATPLLQKLAHDFIEHGFCTLDLRQSDFAEMAAQVRADLHSAYAGSVRLPEAWRISPTAHKLTHLPQVMEALKFLYGRTPFPFQTLNFNRGSEQRIHSDVIHFHSAPARFMCGLWIALEKTDVGNGPLIYYPGSHKLPIFKPEDLGLMHLNTFEERYAAYERLVAEILQERGLKPKTLHLPQGHAAIWAANLFHGGSPIVDPLRTRHSQVVRYYFEDCVYYSPLQSNTFAGRTCFKDVDDIARRTPMQRAAAMQRRNLLHQVRGLPPPWLRRVLHSLWP